MAPEGGRASRRRHGNLAPDDFFGKQVRRKEREEERRRWRGGDLCGAHHTQPSWRVDVLPARLSLPAAAAPASPIARPGAGRLLPMRPRGGQWRRRRGDCRKRGEVSRAAPCLTPSDLAKTETCLSSTNLGLQQPQKRPNSNLGGWPDWEEGVSIG